MPLPDTVSPLFLAPSNPKVTTGGSVQFTVLGGVGPYAWSVSGQSGSPVITDSGNYTAGAVLGGLDVVKVTDSTGEECVRDVEILSGPTLASIRATAQQRSDLQNSDFVTDPEWNGYINGGYTELYDRLIAAYDNDYNIAEPYAFTTDGITERYPLPPDVYKPVGVDISRDGRDWKTVHRFNRVQRNLKFTPFSRLYGISADTRYRLHGRYIWLSPAPPPMFMRLIYIPRVTKLVQETDVLDGINGWEEYVILDAVIKARNKREEDVSEWKALKQEQGARIDALSENRDAGEPATVVDVRSEEEDPNDWWKVI